jgi:cell division protein DivIC
LCSAGSPPGHRRSFQTPYPDITGTMKFLANIPSWLKNKYLLTAAGFTVWILFFDSRDFITSHFRERQELRKLEQSKSYYQKQIMATRQELDQLRSNPALLEKYAREKYLMKKDNEDLFLVRGDQSTVRH